jgi:hypothetical protein
VQRVVASRRPPKCESKGCSLEFNGGDCHAGVPKGHGLILNTIKIYGLTNNIFNTEQRHTISVFMKSECPQNQTVINNEPNNIKNWEWFRLNNLPDNLFLSLVILFKNRLCPYLLS